jgi:hypothetical protein
MEYFPSICFIIGKFGDILNHLRGRYVRLPNLTARDAKKVELCRIWCSHSDGYEEVCLVEYNAAYVDFQRTT